VLKETKGRVRQISEEAKGRGKRVQNIVSAKKPKRLYTYKM